MSDLVSAMAAVLALAVAAIVYSGQRRLAHMEVARCLHHDLTSGEVADAREVLGTLRYGDAEARAKLDPGETLTAYFTLLWCFERIRAGRVSLMDRLVGWGRPAAVRYLDDLLHWHLVEWSVALPIAREHLTDLLGVPIDDSQSASAFWRLLAEHGAGNLDTNAAPEASNADRPAAPLVPPSRR